MFWRAFCVTLSPPLDHRRWCRDLARELAALDLGGIDLTLAPLNEALEGLEAALGQPLTSAHLRRIAHHLIPLDHTTGDRFHHDAAMPRAPWPVLAPLRVLADSAPEDAPFARVTARQAINRIAYALGQARRDAESNF